MAFHRLKSFIHDDHIVIEVHVRGRRFATDLALDSQRFAQQLASALDEAASAAAQFYAPAKLPAREASPDGD